MTRPHRGDGIRHAGVHAVPSPGPLFARVAGAAHLRPRARCRIVPNRETHPTG